MTVKDQLICKTEALRAVQNHCEELLRARALGSSSPDELLNIHRYIETMIANYKQLAKDLNNNLLSTGKK